MTDWSYERIEMPQLGVLRYNISGLETNADTAHGQALLCDRLKSEPQWTGVLFDYSQCEISYTLAEFSERLNYVIKNFPSHIKIAYVFNSQTFVVSARASKLLTSSGFQAQAFPNAEDALDYLSSNGNWTRRA